MANGRKRSVSKSPGRKPSKGRKSRSVSRGRPPSATPKQGGRKSTPSRKTSTASSVSARSTPARSTSRGRKSPAPSPARSGVARVKREVHKLAKTPAGQHVIQVARDAKAQAKAGATEVRRRVLPLVEQRLAPQAKRAASKTRAHLRRWGTYYVLIAALLLISFVIYQTGHTIQATIHKYWKTHK